MSTAAKLKQQDNLFIHPWDDMVKIGDHRRTLLERGEGVFVYDSEGNRLLDAPAGYGLGGEENCYFSHMLNCVYDCGYCFLQGMFRSAHQVLFVNYEDFMRDVDERLEASPNGPVWFFSGYVGETGTYVNSRGCLNVAPLADFVDAVGGPGARFAVTLINARGPEPGGGLR